MASKTTQDTQIEKLYDRLLKEPEKGAVEKTFSIQNGKKVHSGYSPTLEEFKSIIQSKMNDPDMFDPDENYSWAYKLSVIKKGYGIGPSVSHGDEINRNYEQKNIGNTQAWWQRKKTHLSSDPRKQYYIVPLVFENMLKNPNLADYVDASGKIEVGHPAPKGKGGGRGLLGDPEFVNKCKLWALGKLEKDLDKEIRKDKIVDLAHNFGFMPQNKIVDRGRDVTTGAQKEVPTAQAWHIIPRRPEYQTLWVKIMFDRGWVDSLPQKSNKVDMSKVSREVLVLVKDFDQYLKNLQKILFHFDAQMNIAFAEEGFETSFNAKCSANSVKEIYGVINGLFRANSLPSLKDIKENTPLGAIQFGFTEEYVLQYVSFSEVADCLCEEGADITPYILKEGLNSIRGSGPFSVPRINNFLHMLPEINRRYGKYLKSGGNYSTDLFSMHQSWLDFINTYVYPTPETNYNGEAKPTLESLVDPLQLKNPIFKDLLFTGKYIKDPTNLMSPDVKNLIAGTSNVTNMYSGDENLLKAVFGEIKSMSELFDKLLNRIPIAELIKMASALIFKCAKNSAMKRHMCQTILKTVPISEIRQQLYPCLRNVPNGDLAIAKLEEKITGRVGDVYKIASARYPERFPPDPSEPWTETQIMVQLIPLYCSDPYMQKKLGRSPGDFNQEMLDWAEEVAGDAICDCVLASYGPITKMLEYVEELTDQSIDGMTTAAKDKLYDNDQNGTLAIDRFVDPIKKYLKSTDKLESFRKSFAKGLKDMAMSIVYATAMVVLKYVKEQFNGGLTQDLCNGTGDPFGFTSPRDWILNSSIYKDSGDNELWDKFGELKTKHFFNQDVQTLYDGFEKLGDVFSPSELKRLFTTECGDDSFEGSYEDAALAFMDEGTIMALQVNFPGLSLAAIAAQTGYDPNKKDQTYEKEDPTTGDITVLPFPPGFISPDQAQALLLDLGSLIDSDVYDAAIDEYNAFQEALVGLCDPINVDELEKSIWPEDILAIAEGDQQQALEDATSMLPFIDPNMMKSLYPPLFCGPCAPDQIGMKPLMPSQTHETQLFMQERLADKTYKAIDDSFNNTLAAYKPLIKETFNPNMMTALLNSIKSAAGNESTAADPSLAYMKAVTGMLNNSQESYNADTDGENNKLVAKKFRGLISDIIASNTQNEQLIFYDPENAVGSFEYVLPGTSYSLDMVFNFSGTDIVHKGMSIPSPQIKIISYNGGVKEYEYPPAGQIAMEADKFDLDDFQKELFDYFLFNPDIPKGTVVAAMMAATQIADNIFKGIFPLAANLMLETVWDNASQTDLFKAKNFNALPLTNEEAQSKCLETNPTPLLDPEKTKADVEEVRKSLECMVSMFDTPDAIQIANMFGLYKMLIKVCIAEEYLKNIFMFSFAKISDIIEDEAYMSIIKSAIRSSVESSLSSGYENLLDYSQKVVRARLADVDVDSMTNEDGSPLTKAQKAEQTRVKTREESLDMIIVETALEVDKLMDERVRKFANPAWKDQFTKLDDVDYFKNDFFKYSIHREIMQGSRFPTRQETENGELEVNKMPLFRQMPDPSLVNYEDYSVYSQSPKPFPSKREGGLFFEPYVRMRSKLTTASEPPTSLEAADVYYQDFWKRFKQAFSLWETAIFRNIKDVNAYGGVANDGTQLGEVPEKVDWFGLDALKGWPPPVEDGDPIDATFFTELGGNSLYKDIIPSTESRPYGQFNYRKHYPVIRTIHNFIRKIIGKIEKEYEEHGKLLFVNGDEELSTFWDFFLTFFSPVDKDGRPWKHEFGHGVAGPDGSFHNLRSIFQSTVSSYFPAPSDSIVGKGKETSAYGDKSFYNAFYHWQQYPAGIPLPSQLNFRNRGVVGLDSIGYHNFSETAYQTFKNWNFSFIDIFSAAKEVNPGANKALMDDVLSEPDGPEFNTKWNETLKENNENISPLPFQRVFFEKIAEFMIRHGFDEFAGTLDGLGGMGKINEFYEKNGLNLIGMCEWLKRIVVEAPFDHWFDISMGMRLNLIVPYKGEGVDSSYMENIISELRDVTLEAKIDKDYIQDKTFLLTDGDSATATNWLCLPIEFEEYDLRDYWEQVHEKMHPPGSPPTFGVSAPHFTFSDSAKAPFEENPWSLIMSKISELGLAANQVQYNYTRGSAMDTHANLYNNLFCPLSMDESLMADGLKPQQYYMDASTKDDPVRPTLWATCKLLNTMLAPHSRLEANPETKPNPMREEIIYKMQNKLMDNLKNSDLLNEVLPIKQTSFTTAMIYRYGMLASYPELENLFSSTKGFVGSFIVESLKAIEDDYSYVTPEPETQEEKLSISSPAPNEIAKMFFELVIQAAANTIDPTWKTPWFFPGPLTPVGIIAKLMAQEPDKDKESLPAPEGECEDKTPENN